MAIARPAATAITPKPVHRPVPAPAPAARPGAVADGAATSVGISGHIRRCTYRRVMPLSQGRRELAMYQVDCLHPSYETVIPLGRLEDARAACGACTLPGIFRADDD